MPLEEYVAAVVDAEMPAAFPAAAREAQAIVARTYAHCCREAPLHEWFDLYATPISQNYLGVVYLAADGRLLAGETAAGRAAAMATTGVLCTYEGRPFRTFYSACCGGHTLCGRAVFGDETPALRGVVCGACEEAPLFRWRRYSGDATALLRLAKLARDRMPTFARIHSVATSRHESDLPLILISDGQRTVRLSAVEVKKALSLPGLSFDLSGNADGLEIWGRGHGHSVGLCQWGAKGLAERGLSAREILRHYYPGSETQPWY